MNKAHRVRNRVDKDKALSAKKPITFKKIIKYLTINNKALNAKSRAREIKFPTDKAHKVKNRLNKNKALSAKKLIMSKGIIKKYPFGSNPSGYLQSKGSKT